MPDIDEASSAVAPAVDYPTGVPNSSVVDAASTAVTLAKPQESMLDLLPRGSVLREICDIVAGNTDLPCDGIMVAASTMFAAGLTGIGATVSDAQAVLASSSISTVALLRGDYDLMRTVRDMISPMMIASAVATLPDGISHKQLLEYLVATFPASEHPESGQVTRGASDGNRASLYLLKPDGADWIRQLGGEERSNNAVSLYRKCLAGQPVSSWSKDEGLQRARPVQLSFFSTAHYHQFLNKIEEGSFVAGMDGVLLLNARERPSVRRVLYTSNGIARGTAHYAAHWQRIVEGPRSYQMTADAKAMHADYWQRMGDIWPGYRTSSRKHAEATLGYALILRASSNPDGQIDGATMDRSLKIVGRHFNDRLQLLQEDLATSNWERKKLAVESYLKRHPDATRGDVLRNTRCGTAKDLNTVLETLVEIGGSVGEHAERLLRNRRVTMT